MSSTEKKGRRHTSFVRCYEVSTGSSGYSLKDADIKVDTYRGSGPGGQHRNKTDSAVRMRHLPTGTIVTATEDRSQSRNRSVARKRLEQALDSEPVYEYSLIDQQWNWCQWRDEVRSPNGDKKKMSLVLRRGI